MDESFNPILHDNYRGIVKYHGEVSMENSTIDLKCTFQSHAGKKNQSTQMTPQKS